MPTAPGFRPHDLAQPNFERSAEPVEQCLIDANRERAHRRHQCRRFVVSQPRLRPVTKFGPIGNAVSLEDEMMKVAANQMDFQAATALYTHSLSLIKTALGKR